MARQALGKGLGALIPTHLQDIKASDPAAGVSEIDVNKIKANPFQPRSEFGAEKLKELADSIKEAGVLQPVVVVKKADGSYTLVSGERRLRAVRSLGYQRIPAVVKSQATDQQLAEWALIENLQRDDLNAIEEAKAYQRLITELKLTQEQAAQKVGKDRTTVTNSLRLLKLPAEVQNLVRDGRLSMGHVRALLSIDRPEAQKALAGAAEREGWSVRQMEAAVAGGRGASPRKGGKRHSAGAEVKAIEEKLRRSLGTKVHLKPKGKGGSIEIFYFSEEELERLLDWLSSPK